MILLSDPLSSVRKVAIFGVGLVGSATINVICDRSPLRPHEFAMDWTNVDLQQQQLRAIESQLAAEDGPATKFLDILWSAGRAGFAADRAETSVEMASFRRVLEMAERLALLREEQNVAFHLISSAGGLFEGQRLVSASSRPAPRRAYGELKQEQEQLLLSSAESLVKRIYRPTSVYGYVRPGCRRGLIPTLVWHGVCQRESHIFGRSDTLRDFVWVENIARFIAKRILGDDTGDEIWTLASGKPTSISEVKSIVERIVNRSIYLSYSPDASNSEDMTFSPKVLPPDWRVSDITLSIRRIYDDILRRGMTAESALTRDQS